MKYSYLFTTIPMVLSVVAGIFVIFALIPYWLLDRPKLTTARKTIIGFALLGLLIPLVFEAKYELTRTEILSQSMWLWPSSLGLMAVDRCTTTSQVVLLFGMTGLSNVGLYSFIGWIVSTIRGGRRAGRA
jgi:hypothetical protein